MNDSKKIPIEFLMERAKELECLYLVDEALTKNSISEMLMEISKVLPLGFRNVKDCSVSILLDGKIYSARPPAADGLEIQSPIIVNKKERGYIKALYPKNISFKDGSVFLFQEEKLLNAAARKISQIIYQKNIQELGDSRSNWKAIITLLQNTDHSILLYVCEKMLSLLAKNNQNLVMEVFNEMNWKEYEHHGEINFPLGRLPDVDVISLSKSVFRVASTCLEDTQIFDYINLWIYHGKTYELIKLVGKSDSDVKDISRALRRYLKAIEFNEMPSQATQRWLIVELVRRFLTSNPKLIENARKYIQVEDFCELLDTYICSPKSVGKIGGKASGFFLANKIIKAHTGHNPEFKNIKIPKTWYISSDELVNLIRNNGLDELNEHKYRDILEIRINYPKIIQTIKNSTLSPYVLTELDRIIEECDSKPLIIRSSSLLEDQTESAFSGKYKSLFLANTGTKAERFKSLVDGILEVYASMYNPDSIQYRKERDLLDCTEQMGIMIQEVVGIRAGPYYFPLYAGVAFSNNEFRWSSRLKREDGLLRMVVGLGTRSVDRIGDDYPVLVSPGQPNLRVNQALQELQKYSPQMMDVIDLENNRFSTVPISEVIKKYGNEIPDLDLVASAVRDDIVTGFNMIATDFKTDDIIITFDGLINKTAKIAQIQSIMKLLQEEMGNAIDIEFACDGENFYLLQCRPQSKSHDNSPAAIPADISHQSMVFSASRYISNGTITGIKTVIYIDPEEYGNLEKYQDLVDVGSAVSELNKILPRRSFILIGPGRWGSRGDIKLGVKVTYSDINNCSLLVEIAQDKSKYKPEPSFGTHFFQDLVESNIKYLPLYPEEGKTIFDKYFFTRNASSLKRILPSYSYLSRVIKVINVPENYSGKQLIVLMNADQKKAVAYLDYPDDAGTKNLDSDIIEKHINSNDQEWKWRHYMAEKISEQLDLKEFSVKGIYLFGSTNTCTARLNSDIDLLIHFDGSEEQKKRLDSWLKGWSVALSEINYLKTGYRSDGLLDVHYITDQDIIDKKPFAAKISSIYDPATPLRLSQS